MTSPTPQPRTVGWSPKAVWATVAAFAVSVLVPGALATIEYVSANPDLLSGLPPWARVGALGVLVALGTLLAARKASPGVVTTEPAARRGTDVW
jgi:hypothetical protein